MPVLTLLVMRSVAAGQPAPEPGTLRVGVAGTAPFVLDDAAAPGVSVEIWQAMATDALGACLLGAMGAGQREKRGPALALAQPCASFKVARARRSPA
ncbi:MAG: hypothetical protein AB2A00_29925 [Myxococcota bacterium]